MVERDHRDVLLDQGVGGGVVGQPTSRVELRGRLGQDIGDVLELGPERVVGADPEVVIDPVGHVRIVTAPAQEEQRVLALAGVGEVGGVVLGVDLEVDPEILELRLDLGRGVRRVREVLANLRAEVQVVGLAEVEVGRLQGRDRRVLVVGVPRVALATAGHAARGEVVGHGRARGVEQVEDPLAVDALGDRLADGLVVPRGVVDVEAEVQRAECVTLEELQARVVGDGVEVVGGDVVHAVDGAGLEVLKALLGRRPPT